MVHIFMELWLSGKESACDAAGDTGDLGWILGQEDPMEEGMATHSNILAWKIPWIEEPGELPSRGLQKRDWAWNSKWITGVNNQAKLT